MKRLEVSGAVRLIYKSLSVKGLKYLCPYNTPTKKKQVALIMLIIALQFDVLTSFNM